MPPRSVEPLPLITDLPPALRRLASLVLWLPDTMCDDVLLLAEALDEVWSLDPQHRVMIAAHTLADELRRRAPEYAG